MVWPKKWALLTAAEAARFDLFITADQEIAYQQNLTGRSIAVLVLSTNNWNVIKEQVAEISAATLRSFKFLSLQHRSN